MGKSIKIKRDGKVRVLKDKILLVDDNEDALYAVERMLAHAGFEIFTALDGQAALDVAQSVHPDIILLDVMMPKIDGLEVTRRIKSDDILKFTPVILLTARDSLEDVLLGLTAGADGYITKPFKPDELIARTSAALRTRALYQELKNVKAENQRLFSELSNQYKVDNIIGESKGMKEIFSLIKKVAPSDSPVMISGPSGTGKELVARSIHYNSKRSEGPFIAKNCAAFSEQLLESQLFGHIKGSFTGAIKDQKGLFEAADGGTLFLDELGEMPIHLQAKLLRVLQEGKVMPVGTTEERIVNVRILTATNRDLRKMVEEGSFREDLYFRLNVIHLPIPPLKERKEDIPLLITHFLDRAYEKRGAQRKHITEEVLSLFLSYEWRGNIRELENELERMLILSGEEPELGIELLSPSLRDGSSGSNAKEKSKTPEKSGTEFVDSHLILESSERSNSLHMKDAISKLEKEMIASSLKNNNGNKSVAAKELGISRSSLISKVQEYGLEE